MTGSGNVDPAQVATPGPRPVDRTSEPSLHLPGEGLDRIHRSGSRPWSTPVQSTEGRTMEGRDVTALTVTRAGALQRTSSMIGVAGPSGSGRVEFSAPVTIRPDRSLPRSESR